MATVTPTLNHQVSEADRSVFLASWSLTTANADGAPIERVEWADRTWQAVGTWGGATLAFQGSNDGTNWFPLTNAAGGSAATLSANGGLATVELPRFVRPNLTTPGAGATITVTLCARRATPMRA